MTNVYFSPAKSKPPGRRTPIGAVPGRAWSGHGGARPQTVGQPSPRPTLGPREGGPAVTSHNHAQCSPPPREKVVPNP